MIAMAFDVPWPGLEEATNIADAFSTAMDTLTKFMNALSIPFVVATGQFMRHEGKWVWLRTPAENYLSYLKLVTRNIQLVNRALTGGFEILRETRAGETDEYTSIGNPENIFLGAKRLQSRKLEAISTLAGGIAHEFNNALTVLAGSIELIKMSLPDHVDTQEFSQFTDTSISRLTNLTSQLLAYARGGKYCPAAVNVSEFITDTLPIVMHDLNPEIIVETDLAINLDPIKADIAQLQMIMAAILKNASEAIQGKGCIRITTRSQTIDAFFAANYPGMKPGHYINLIIEDNGIGMDDAVKKRIFDPFFTTKFQGRGLGMAAVYGIVKNHDGYIYIDSGPGEGTVVRIFLPPYFQE